MVQGGYGLLTVVVAECDASLQVQFYTKNRDEKLCLPRSLCNLQLVPGPSWVIEPDTVAATGEGRGPCGSLPSSNRWFLAWVLGKTGGEGPASFHLRLAPVIQGAGPRVRVDPGFRRAGQEARNHAHPQEIECGPLFEPVFLCEGLKIKTRVWFLLCA